MKASDLFVRCLEAEGVLYIFGVPGEENLDLLESLHQSTIKLIVTRHEQAAGFMAATVGRLTGKAGVCLSTLGPGATNLTTAAAYAQLGGFPMVMITGQKPLKTRIQARFQVVDIVAMMQPLTKSARQIITGKKIPHHIREAFRVAQEERQGAVHLELPKDIAAEEVDGAPLVVKMPSSPKVSDEALKHAAQVLMQAKRPLVIFGLGANRKPTPAYQAFIDATHIPFVSTQMGKGAVDEQHPLFLGCAALLGHDYVHCAIERADAILMVGYDPYEKPPFIMQGDKTEVIHLHETPALMEEVYFPQHEVVGKMQDAMQRLTSGVEPQKHWDFSYYLRVKKQVEEQVFAHMDSNAFPLLPQRVVADVHATVPKHSIIALDNGMFKLWFARIFAAKTPNSLLLDNALATMGAGLPSAMAAHLLYPEKKVLAICGDGGFMMNSQELETAVRLRMNLTIVILKDNGYGMIKWEQQMKKFADFGLDFGNPDFVKYAECYGAKGYAVKKAEDFSKILQNCLTSQGVQLIEVPIDYSQNDAVFTQELAHKQCVL
ncbi:acetolactate synthase large subunit [Candidatus Woesearchaeota archaeon]|nr:acetolactate synthase large subunit [Candidatus Woesearchaeota archaeon]